MPSPSPKRPMAKVQRVALISRQVTERLGLAGAELLLSQASRMSEGQLLPDGHYFGSTMLTIDLEQLATAGLLSDTCDVSTALKVARLMAVSDALRERVRTVASQEAFRLAEQEIAPTAVEIRVRAEGTLVFIDIDLEGSATNGAIETVG
ncbi:MAG: hypothetical protein JRH20_22950 [Deltaproteobacteria bacterium]|nr:hypothetical protein [Deltaproteobacteria bacterium]